MQLSNDHPATGLQLSHVSRPCQTSGGHRGGVARFFIVLAVLVATGVTGFSWHDLRRARSDTIAHWTVLLSTTADEQVRVITLWLSERQADAQQVAENPVTL